MTRDRWAIELAAVLSLVAVAGMIYGILQVGAGPATSARAGATSPAAASAPPATTAAADPQTARLVATGARLYQANTCAACHSVDGSKGVGPTFKGLDGSQVQLADGTTVRASHAYLKRAIAAPNADIVKGYQKGLMLGAISSYGLANKPDEVRALVAYIASVK